MRGEYTALERQLQLYFDGLYLGDVRLVERVFHIDARYVCATGGTLVNIGMNEYLPMVAARPAPAQHGQLRCDRIVSMEFAGPNTAFARVNCAIGDRYFTDLLTFIRTNEGWQIIAKVFHFEERVPPAVEAKRDCPCHV